MERVMALVENGYSARQAALRYGINPRKAQRWIRHFHETGNLQRKHASGRPRVSTSDEDRRLVAEAVARPLSTAHILKAAAQFPGSRKTVVRRLRESNLFARRAARKQHLKAEHIRHRLVFAQENLERDWKETMFSDECSISSANVGPVIVYRPKGKRFDKRYVAQTRTSGRVSVSVWGWMSAQGLGSLYRIEGHLDSDQYIHILQNVLLPSVRDHQPGRVITLQHDRSSIHTSKPVRSWLSEQHDLHVIDWPAYAPDLNVIENVWSEVKRILRQNLAESPPTTSGALWDLVLEAWEQVAEKEGYCQRLVDSMQERLRTVIAADGFWTQY
jgi:transposase-like protein/transposase